MPCKDSWTVQKSVGIPSFLKVYFMLLCFDERPALIPAFSNCKKTEKNFLLGKKVKTENSVWHLFCHQPYGGSTPHKQRERPLPAPSPDTQHLSIQRPELWTVSVGVCALSWFFLCASISKMCPNTSEKPKRGNFLGLGILKFFPCQSMLISSLLHFSLWEVSWECFTLR